MEDNFQLCLSILTVHIEHESDKDRFVNSLVFTVFCGQVKESVANDTWEISVAAKGILVDGLILCCFQLLGAECQIIVEAFEVRFKISLNEVDFLLDAKVFSVLSLIRRLRILKVFKLWGFLR